jgi:hypothetical protein
MSYDGTPKDFPLRFSYGNDKLENLARMLKLKLHQVAGFGLLAGVTCPSADLCKARSLVVDNRRTLKKQGKYTCFMAALEVAFTNLYELHKANTIAVSRMPYEDIALHLNRAIYDNGDLRVMRVDTSGDFYTEKYYRAWIEVATTHRDITFFGYTKELGYLLDLLQRRMHNFHFVYSYGGTSDPIAAKWPWLPYSKVVLNEQHAEDLGLPVACPTPDSPDDYNYIINRKSFALLAHSTTKKNLKLMAKRAKAERSLQ